MDESTIIERVQRKQGIPATPSNIGMVADLLKAGKVSSEDVEFLMEDFGRQKAELRDNKHHTDRLWNAFFYSGKGALQKWVDRSGIKTSPDIRQFLELAKRVSDDDYLPVTLLEENVRNLIVFAKKGKHINDARSVINDVISFL
jgi:hypothetical protein